MEQPTDDSKSNLQQKLAAIEAFIGSAAYSSYVSTIKADIAGAETSILATPPVSETDRASVFTHFGRREELLRALTFFEEARSSLKDRIDEIAEREAEKTGNKEQE